MNVTAPAFAPLSSGQIVGFNLDAAAGDSPAGTITFGQVFADGDLPSARTPLIALLNGAQTAVQVDPKTVYADGSVEFAVLTLEAPAIAAGETLNGLLALGSSSQQPEALDLESLLRNHDISVKLDYQGGPSLSVDVGASLAAALADGSANVWLQGPLASQARVSIPLQGSMRLLATVTAYVGGAFSVQIGYDNDIAMGTSGGEVSYATTISIDGTTVYSNPAITQAQYQDWNTRVLCPVQSVPTALVQHDPAYLEAAQAIPNFNLQNGVDPSAIDYYSSRSSSPDWDLPLATNDVTTYMPATGGRGDIGITTAANSAWLTTQDPAAEKYALGQADTAGSVDWNFWDETTGAYLNTDVASRIWIDPRAVPYYTPLTQQQPTDTPWTADTCHQPDLSYYAYMMTGDQSYLDELNAQASFSITDEWPDWRGASGELVVGADQVRGSAWNLREIDEAAWANPAGSYEGNYFNRIAADNWKWLDDQIPAWTQLEGQAYGYVQGYSVGTDQFRPWMQDYFASVAVEAVRHGNQDALTFLKWEENFLVGRFENADNGFNPNDGIAYNLCIGTPSGTPYTTWAQIENATVAEGYSNGNGWGWSIGDYGELALQTLSGIVSVDPNPQNIQAYNWLITADAPYTSLSSMARDTQFDVIPQLPAGYIFAADREIVADPSSSPGPSSPSPSVSTPSSPGPSPGTPSGSSPSPSSPDSNTADPSSSSSDPPPVASDPNAGSAPQAAPTQQAQIAEPDLNTVQIRSHVVEMFRFFDTSSGAHLFTVDAIEAASLRANPQFAAEANPFGAASPASLATDPDSREVYRLFETTTGSHFYTSSKLELNSLIDPDSAGYRPDLVFEPTQTFVEHDNAEAGDNPVYRFFDTKTGDHFFTASLSEYQTITDSGGAGFRPDLAPEGIAFYAPAVNVVT